MSRPTVLAAGALLCAAALAGCGGSKEGAGEYGGSGSSADKSAPAAAAASGTSITIKDFAFSPKSLTVKAGTTIKATNLDSATHTWTGNGGAFDSGSLDTGKSFSFTFKSPGTFAYICSIHPSMRGTIVVTS